MDPVPKDSENGRLTKDGLKGKFPSCRYRLFRGPKGLDEKVGEFRLRK